MATKTNMYSKEVINVKLIDEWNKDNPYDSYSYEECEKGLEEGIPQIAEAMLESFLEKMDEWNWTLEPEYMDWCGDAVSNTGAVDREDLECLVKAAIRSSIQPTWRKN